MSSLRDCTASSTFIHFEFPMLLADKLLVAGYKPKSRYGISVNHYAANASLSSLIISFILSPKS